MVTNFSGRIGKIAIASPPLFIALAFHNQLEYRNVDDALTLTTTSTVRLHRPYLT